MNECISKPATIKLPRSPELLNSLHLSGQAEKEAKWVGFHLSLPPRFMSTSFPACICMINSASMQYHFYKRTLKE